MVSGDLFQRLLWKSTLVVCFDSSTESEAFLGDKTLPSPHLSLSTGSGATILGAWDPDELLC